MTLIEVEILKKYFENENKQGELFIDNVWIRSNKHYVFFGEENPLGKTFALFSKKFYMTVELSKDKNVSLVLDRIAEVTTAPGGQRAMCPKVDRPWPQGENQSSRSL